MNGPLDHDAGTQRDDECHGDQAEPSARPGPGMVVGAGHVFCPWNRNVSWALPVRNAGLVTAGAVSETHSTSAAPAASGRLVTNAAPGSDVPVVNGIAVPGAPPWQFATLVAAPTATVNPVVYRAGSDPAAVTVSSR